MDFFPTLEPKTSVLENVAKARATFKELQQKLVINVVQEKPLNEGIQISFSYYNGFNNSSHKVSIIGDENGVFLKTYRMKSVSVFNKYDIVTTFAHGYVSYLIPIEDEVNVLRALLLYDRFQKRY